MNDSSIYSMSASTQIPITPAVIYVTVWSNQEELPPVLAPATGPNEDNIHVSSVAERYMKARSYLLADGLRMLHRVNWAGAVLVIFGVLLILASFLDNVSDGLAITLALAGVSITAASVLYFFVSPSRLVDIEVSDAMSLSNAELLNTLLEPLVGDAKGVYIPSSAIGATQVMVMTKDSAFSKAYLDKAASITSVNSDNKHCIFMTPPGYGLYSYVKSLGASFTRDGLEDQIRDVLVNGLELAPSVEVSCGPDNVHVKVGGLSGSPLCKAMRQKGKKVCEQVGCPICSFIACMVAEGTGMRAMISDVNFDQKAVMLSIKLL